jgi:hypothetical protein
MRASRIAGAVIAALATVLVSGEAKADDREPVFRYTKPAKRYWLRTTIEELGILGAGYAQYVDNRASNERDFDNSPNWDTLKSKVTLGSALTFDNNLFDTNWLTHPLAGWFYYGVARSNRVSIPASAAIAFFASTLWEVLGEIREDAAINDLVSTPFGGMAVYEPMMQTGAVFQRAKKTPASTALGWLFAPLKSIHDAIDGLETERATEIDDMGMPVDEWHRIRLGGSAGVTHQQGGVTQGDARFYGESRVVALPRYGRKGSAAGWFGGAEVSELRVQAGFSEGEAVDIQIASSALPAGYRWQDAHGQGIIAGLHVGTEYGRHDYDRDRRREPDRIALVAAGTTIEETTQAGPLLVRTRLDVLGNFAGVESYALPAYAANRGVGGLTSILAIQHYYHAYGATLRPRLELELGRMDGGFDLRADWFHQITGRDRGTDPVDESIAARDRRLMGRTFIGVRPTPHIRLSVTGELSERMGRVANIQASRSEVGVHAGIEALF